MGSRVGMRNIRDNIYKFSGALMNHDEILHKVTAVVQDQLDLDTLQLADDTLASDVEGWDSLAHVRIMIAVEQAFGIRFQTSQITGIASVGELIALVESMG